MGTDSSISPDCDGADRRGRRVFGVRPEWEEPPLELVEELTV